MTSADIAAFVSLLTEHAQVCEKRNQVLLASLQERKAASDQKMKLLEQILIAGQALLSTTQTSIENFNISNHLSHWLAEYNPQLSDQSQSIFEFVVLSQQTAQTNATLPAERTLQLGLSLIAESLTLQRQNAILHAQCCRKAAEFNLQQTQRNSERLHDLATLVGLEGRTAECFQIKQLQQDWLAKEHNIELETVSFYSKAEENAIAQFEQTQHTLQKASIAKRRMSATEVDKLSKQCDGVFAVWLQNLQTEVTKHRNLQSRLKVELRDPEKVNVDNMELEEKYAKKAKRSEGNHHQESQV